MINVLPSENTKAIIKKIGAIVRFSDSERADIRKTKGNLLHWSLVSEIRDEKFM